MPIAIESLADLVALTNLEKGYDQWKMLANTLQRYPGAKQLLSEKRRNIQSGWVVERNL